MCRGRVSDAGAGMAGDAIGGGLSLVRATSVAILSRVSAMPSVRLVLPLAAVIALAAPASAVAQSGADDNQYSDPFANTTPTTQTPPPTVPPPRRAQRRRAAPAPRHRR